MKCRACGHFIGVEEVLYPEGEHPKADRTQQEHPFPVAACKKCGKINQITIAGGNGWTERIVEDDNA